MIVEIRFTVHPDGGEPYDITAGPRDVLVWEKTTPGAIASSLGEEQHLADLYKIAWITARRLGFFQGTLKEFEETNDLDNGKEPPAVDPTHPDPSAGS